MARLCPLGHTGSFLTFKEKWITAPPPSFHGHAPLSCTLGPQNGLTGYNYSFCVTVMGMPLNFGYLLILMDHGVSSLPDAGLCKGCIFFWLKCKAEGCSSRWCWCQLVPAPADSFDRSNGSVGPFALWLAPCPHMIFLLQNTFVINALAHNRDRQSVFLKQFGVVCVQKVTVN